MCEMSRPRAATSVAIRTSRLLRPEQAHHLVALPLLHAAVQRLGPLAVGVERLDQRLDLEARPAEHQRRHRVFHVDDAGERRRLVGALDDVGDLPHVRRLALGRLLALDGHPRRILQVALGDLQDPRRHRRREQRGLPGLGQRREDRVEIVREAHVEHLVGFVEDQDLEAGELQRLAADVVEDAAGRADHDVDAALQRPHLLVHRRAAVERQHRAAERLAVLVHGFGDLHRQLARRHEHHARGLAGLAARGPLGGDPVQHRQRERRGLAGAGAGLREDVAPLEQERDRFALDGGGLFVAQRGEGGDELGAEAELVERLVRGGGPIRALDGRGVGLQGIRSTSRRSSPRGTRRCCGSCPSSKSAAPSLRPVRAGSAPCGAPTRG